MKKVMGMFVNFVDLGPPLITRNGIVLVTLAVALKMTLTSGQWDSYLHNEQAQFSQFKVYSALPGPKPKIMPWNYNFKSVESTFGSGVDIKAISDFSRYEFEQMILLSLPLSLRDHLRPYLKMILETAEEYQIDPFWVLAVVWTESHFNPEAVSPVKAIGLMQVMPGTSHYLLKKMNRPMSPKLAYHLAADPSMNVKMGSFYLKFLLEKFEGNYIHATVSYNMGPYGVIRRLKNDLPVGVRNNYLDKVRHAYQRITRYTEKYF